MVQEKDLDRMRQYDWGGTAVPLTLALFILIVWEGVTWMLKTPEYLLPRPSIIVTALWDNRDILWPHIGQTMLEVAIGVGIAIVVGVVTAALLELSPLLRRAFYPLLVVSQTIPILALAPLLVIWFGFGVMPKVLIVTLFCYFPIAINTTDGFTAAEREFIDLLRSMGASTYQIWRKVKLPSALPYFFSGLKIAVTYSVVAAVIGEWVGAQQGLGIYLLRSGASFRTAQVFGAIGLISVLSIVLFVIVAQIERVALPWYFAERRK